MNYAYNNSILDSIVCKIKIEDKEKRYEHGSGVILQMDNEDYVYILTAKHCILGKELNYKREDINITVYVKLDNVYKEIEISEQELIIYDDNPLNDRAIIILKKANEKSLDNIKSIEFFDLNSIPIECCFRGYPAPYNLGEKNVAVTVGMCQFIENNIIGTKTKLETTVYDEALYNISGCSGGGVFVFYNNKIHLVSIVYEFEELFQRIKVNNISGYNELLNEHSFKLIEFNEYFSEKDIPLSKLKCEFQKAKIGWLADRYVPDLHAVGKIQGVTDNITQKNSVLFNMVSLLITDKNIIIQTLDTIKYSITDSRFTGVIQNLEEFSEYLNELLKNIDKLILHIENNSVINYNNSLENTIDLLNLIDEVKSIEDKNYQFRNARILREELEKLRDAKIEESISKILHINKLKFVIFLGEPGTGKTHALANIVDKQINSNLPAILIQAKQYSNAKSWKEILLEALGLSSSFSEDDIWNALEDTASRCEIGKNTIKDLENREIKFQGKVLICVDGIDESVQAENWIDRIREIDIICNKYKRLRFIISSRPYTFKKINIKNKVNIPIDGDVNVHKIFDYYIEKYNVRFEGENIKKRVKWSLKTPFALKLFCEKYSHKEINSTEKISLTISNLLSEKIERIDKEINKKLNSLWTDAEFIIKNILINIVNYFIKESEYMIEHNKLINLLRKDVRLSELQKLEFSKILNYLEQYGLLYMRKTLTSEDPLEDPVINYEIQIQPLVDYLIAIKLRSIDVNENKYFPKVLHERIGAQQMYSLILLEEKKVLVGSNGIWSDYCDNEELIKIQSFALANVSSDIAEKYKDFIENLIKSSTTNLRLIVNNLISEIARIPNHPLGTEFLHSILMSYKTPAERDIIWSGPEKIKSNSGEIWEGESECICSTKGLELTIEDTFDGLPLIYAWQLTNLDNRIRRKSRNELTKWGIDRPKEFYKLLDKVYATNDPQMKEDIMICLLGIITSMKICNEDLKEFANWIISNIFEKSKIQHNKNVVIRFAARIVVEKAFKYNLVEEEKVFLARPPYKYDIYNDIELSKKVVDEKSDSFTPITGDLSWYVIKRAYENFFEVDREYTEEEKISNSELIKFIEKNKYEDSEFEESYNTTDDNVIDEDIEVLLEQRLLHHEKNKDTEKEISIPDYSSKAIEFLKIHGEKVDEKFIMPHLFALSAAVNYIEKMGWNCTKFKYYDKEDDKEIYGFDIAISRQYWPATHGSMSSVMTSGEKYTWCSIHEIQGYLADRLPYYSYSDNGKEKYILDDYSVLVDISNTFIGIQEIDEDEIRNRNYPYMPNDLAPMIENLKDDNIDNIKSWIDKAKYPDFKTWLISDDKAMTMVSAEFTGSWTNIYNFMVVTERYTHSDSILWINSYLIKEEDYDIFKDQLKNSREDLIQYFVKTHDEGYSYPNVGTYMDPATLTLIDWVKELYTKHTIEYKTKEVNNEYDVYKTISKITYKTNNDEEFWSVIPSKIMRTLLDINITDGFNYKDTSDNLIMFNSITGKKYNNEQNILYVKSNKMREILNKKGYKMFWVVKVLREPSLEVRDKYKEFFYDRYCVWIITEDSFEMYKLCDGPKTW
ncbi:ATPase AAA [Paraclostridium sordellii]|uniref:ATPase AAA n=1 Tax=Paraclostridium sordellii TaxID=1505 RepID=UPI000386DD72|nr:ATPase AAA [Paeniclostridium sordellii]EPZ62058.1 AAA domain protein [[Clostridium] sordellii VPI 9048] [Paeniclostridium sordellii VPI 9048]EPZ62064.1 AAA domain protein [[Clostridium] sordellii VPI 9048] [Paeniclostridium sordellii VPI 9048]CEK37653.1 hypothetical protein JGS6382_09851 [[Clostridium] sordellii] [Paeniclostridium sordellii]